jgi:hypothetical protein
MLFVETQCIASLRLRRITIVIAIAFAFVEGLCQKSFPLEKTSHSREGGNDLLGQAEIPFDTFTYLGERL